MGAAPKDSAVVALLRRILGLHQHDYRFIRNIYGDEVVYSGWNRSRWMCRYCNKLKYSPSLHEETK